MITKRIRELIAKDGLLTPAEFREVLRTIDGMWEIGLRSARQDLLERLSKDYKWAREHQTDAAITRIRNLILEREEMREEISGLEDQILYLSEKISDMEQDYEPAEE